VCSYVRFVSLRNFVLFVARATRLGSSSLSTCSTDPGGLRAGPHRRAHGHLVFPRARGPSDVRCPEYATTRHPPSHRYYRFFLLSLPLSLSLSLSSHAFHWSRLSIRPFSLFSISSASYFGISRETSSPKSSSAAFEQLPDPLKNFIRAIRFYSLMKRIYVQI